MNWTRQEIRREAQRILSTPTVRIGNNKGDPDEDITLEFAVGSVTAAGTSPSIRYDGATQRFVLSDGTVTDAVLSADTRPWNFGILPTYVTNPVTPSNSWTAVTFPVTMREGSATETIRASFEWAATPSVGTTSAEYRWRDVDNGVTLASGTHAPGTFTAEIETNIATATNLPTTEAKVQLEVQFDTVDGSGTIVLTSDPVFLVGA